MGSSSSVEGVPVSSVRGPGILVSGFLGLNLLLGYHGDPKLTFFIILGSYRDETTPKRLKVTYSTTRLRVYRCRMVWGFRVAWAGACLRHSKLNDL